MKNPLLLLFLPLFLLVSNFAFGHCQVPCGIYEDSIRISLIREHITTIEKSMHQINEISTETQPNYNQLVRWVNNKEEHATKIQFIVSDYFLHQRIKIVKSNESGYSLYQNSSCYCTKYPFML